MRSFLLFLAFEEGGWFLPGLLDFLDFLEFLQFWALFFWNEIFVFGFFGVSAVSSAFFFKTLPEPGFFLEFSIFFRPTHLTRICLVIPIQLAVVLSSQILLLLSVLSSVN